MASAGATEYLASWAAKVRYEDLPESVVEEAKSQVMSVVAAVHAGAETEEGKIVGEVVRGWGAGDRATLIPSGARGTLHQAIYANAALSMALDYDDYLFAGHTGHSAVLVSLALCEALGLPGRDWLLAQVIANEIEGRIGASVLLGPLNGQLWSFIHLAGGAVIAGRLMGLDAARIRSALGIAFLQPPHGLWAPFFGSGAKTILGAGPAVAGVQAAEPCLRVRKVDDVVSDAHLTACPPSRLAPSRPGGRRLEWPGLATRARPAGLCAARPGVSRW